MSDVTNWQCPDCGTIVSGPSHACSGRRVEIIDPRDARLALAHEIALAAREVSSARHDDHTGGNIEDIITTARERWMRLDALLARYFTEATE